MTNQNDKSRQNVEVQAKRREPSETATPSGESFLPLVDVYHDGDATYLVGEMPGVSSQDVKIEVDKGVLTISGSASWQEPSEGYAPSYVGFVGGQYYRAFALSDEIDREKISASMANGLLKLTLPKAEAAKTRRVQITAE